MSWHGQTPWAAAKAVALLKIREIVQIGQAAERGEVAPAKALQQIEEMASRETDRIVRVGNQHTPEIQTCRDGSVGGPKKTSKTR
jgi:hypothetical protein